MVSAGNDLRCTHRGSPIEDESSMESQGDAPFCCRNYKLVGASAGTR